jgi:hypothetical protein
MTPPAALLTAFFQHQSSYSLLRICVGNLFCILAIKGILFQVGEKKVFTLCLQLLLPDTNFTVRYPFIFYFLQPPAPVVSLFRLGNGITKVLFPEVHFTFSVFKYFLSINSLPLAFLCSFCSNES